MNLANQFVGLFLWLRTPFFVVSLIAGIWAGMRLNSGRLDKSTRALAWIALVTSVLVAVGYLGEVVLFLKIGAGGNSFMSLFFAVLWGYFSLRSYKILKMLGAA